METKALKGKLNPCNSAANSDIPMDPIAAAGIFRGPSLAVVGSTQESGRYPESEERAMASGHLKPGELLRHGLEAVDPVWAHIRGEAEGIVQREPELGGFVIATILNHETLESAIAHRIAGRLDHEVVPAELIAQAFASAVADQPSLGESFRADIVAVADRDPACMRFIEPLLYFKEIGRAHV